MHAMNIPTMARLAPCSSGRARATTRSSCCWNAPRVWRPHALHRAPHLNLQQQQQQQQRQRTPCCRPPGREDSGGSGASSESAGATPALMDGVNWYCYTVMTLLFAADFTPLGAWLMEPTTGAAAAAGAGGGLLGSPPARLALLQWSAFVLPSLAWARSRGWDLAATLQLRPPAQSWQLLAGLAGGPLLWLAVNAAVAAKTGNMHLLLGGGGGSGSEAGVAAGSAAGLLLGAGSGGGGGLQQAPALLLTAAVSPAVAEELLFRGLLLTALQSRLGRVDAVAVAAALFALIHLQPEQFFLYCVLGLACGAAVLRSGSVWTGVALHAGFNGAALAAGLLVASAS